jgi:hypothetical protein
LTGIPIPTDHANSENLAVGDVDGDGDQDLIMCGCPFFDGRARPRLYLNDGAGQFTDSTFGQTSRTPDRERPCSADLAMADVDGDGDLDVVETTEAGLILEPVRIWNNSNGLGYFIDTYGTPDSRFPPHEQGQNLLAVGDVNGDGSVDVVTAVANAQPLLFLNDGSGHFRFPSPEDEAGLPDLVDRMSARDMVFADLDNDGDLDLFIASIDVGFASPHDQLLINSNGRGLFVVGNSGPVTGIPLRRNSSGTVGAGDLDRDGDIDLIVDDGVDLDQLLMNDGSGFFVDRANESDSGLPYFFQSYVSMKLADLDADGDLDIVTVFGPTNPQSSPEVGIRVLFNR